MNAKISKYWDVLVGQVLDNQYSSNVLHVAVTMITNTDDSSKTNIAYERVCYWMDECFHDSVLIDETDVMVSAHASTGRRLLQLPSQPIDSTVGVMLFRKLTAIVENQFVVTDLDLSSSRGDGVIYHHNCDESTWLLAEPGWWSEPGPGYTKQEKSKHSKVIALGKSFEWSDLGLAFDQDRDKASSTVFFGKFPRDNK